jgi:hypothetical protein
VIARSSKTIVWLIQANPAPPAPLVWISPVVALGCERSPLVLPTRQRVGHDRILIAVAVPAQAEADDAASVITRIRLVAGRCLLAIRAEAETGDRAISASFDSFVCVRWHNDDRARSPSRNLG